MREPTQGIKFFRLTSDRRVLWLPALGRNREDDISAHNVICSLHFSSASFLPNGKLKKDALPTLKLKPGKPGFTSFRRHLEHHLRLTERQPLLLPVAVEAQAVALEPLPSNSSVMEESDEDGLVGSPKKRRKLVRLDHCYYLSPRKVNQTLGQNKAKVRNLKSLVLYLQTKKLINDEAHKIIETSCSGVPETLIKRLFDSRKGKVTRKTFPPELRSFAMTLSFFSTVAYEYVRNTFTLALPARSTIRAWMTNIHCLPGFSQTAFDLLKGKVEENNRLGKSTLCALMLDEMAIKKQIDFVAGKSWGYVDLGTGIEDDNPDCATEVLVLMVVAIDEHWKLPIAYFFITGLTGATKANVVKEALIKLNDVGVCITSLTADGPNANYTMMEELGAKVKNILTLQPYFFHPSTDQPVHCILDACHMLKLLRNCWATLGVLIDDEGKRVEWAFVERLHALQEQEGLRFANKLSKAHIEWQSQEMKVKLVTQTLSNSTDKIPLICGNSVSDAINFLETKMKHPGFQNAGPTIRFLKIVNNLFDLLNSRNPIGKECHAPLKESNVSCWKPILLSSVDYLSSLKTVDGRFLHLTNRNTSIRGFIITIKSSIALYDQYVSAGPLSYFLTYKVSQDHLELHFCSIRARNGWNNNPTAMQFYHTFKRLLVRHDLSNIKGNCTIQDSFHLLSAVPSTYQRKIYTISVDDVHMIKKFGLDCSDIQIGDHDYAIPKLPPLTAFCQNVVGYISGFVVRMMKRKIKCQTCILSLHDVASTSSTLDTALLLVDQQNKGALLRPSKDLMEVLLIVEKNIKKVFTISDGKMPKDDSFYLTFCHQLAMSMFAENKVFKSLNDHRLECSLLEESHIMRVIKTAVLCYTKIRLYHVTQRQSQLASGELIRKKYTKLFLFPNQ
ncbi:hypothetical protein PPYR_09665 [Photinus pyralis]|nr:hypothetical protein PPYR_09665 [Photinus pyralis]